MFCKCINSSLTLLFFQRAFIVDDENEDGDFDEIDQDVIVATAIEENIKFILMSLCLNTSIGPIVTKAMLYSLITNKTQVDKDLSELRNGNKIMWFSFRSSSTDYLMLFKDYDSVLQKILPDCNISYSKFIDAFKNQSDVIYFSKIDLKGKFCLSDDAINTLIGHKLLIMNSNSMYEFSIPNSGNFMELLSQGKNRILNVLGNRPSNEILEKELLDMKLRDCSLGTKYLLYDLIGNGQVKSVKCGMGNLIRLIKK